MDELLRKINILYEKGNIKNQLQKLTIDWFRAFEHDTTICFDHPLTVFVGKNGAGKSTALKLLKTLSKKREPKDYFFETVIDPEDIRENNIFSFEINGKKYENLKIKNQWVIVCNLNDLNNIDSQEKLRSLIKNGKKAKPNININDIEFKTLIGAFDKSLFFDNISRSQNMDRKISYTRKQLEKLMQNKMNKSNNKTTIYLSENELKEVNCILEKNYKKITIFRHKYFGGTWGTTILFVDDREYSEFNSGSGEFIIATIVHKINTLNDGSILLLDEPEISIHPGAQKRFMKYLLKMILAKKLQVIISTHSPTIIEKLPDICIKNFTINSDNKIEVSNKTNYLEAFYNLECSFNKKSIIVEDDLAREILLSICTEEKYSNLFEINFFPGGAESIKTLLITAFSKSNTQNKFIVFDGDKYVKSVIKLDSIPEIEKNINFYKKEFESITGVNSSNVKWGINGNKNNSNQNQKDLELSELIVKYLEFYKNNVYFFPEQIPEQIIFDWDYAKTIFRHLDLSEIEQTKNFKEKFLKLSCLTGIDIKALEKIFVSYFVKQKKSSENYHRLKNILDKILSI